MIYAHFSFPSIKHQGWIGLITVRCGVSTTYTHDATYLKVRWSKSTILVKAPRTFKRSVRDRGRMRSGKWGKYGHREKGGKSTVDVRGAGRWF